MGLREAMRRAVARLRERSGGGPACPDPIDHPDLRRMSPRELADIPFPPFGRVDGAVGPRAGRDGPWRPTKR